MRLSDWNGLDWLLAAILLLSVIAGLWRGFLRTVLGLAGVLGGFLLAAWKYAHIEEWLIETGWIKSPTVAMVAGYLLIVAFVVLAFELIARILQKSVRAVGMGFVDRMLGLLFGFARGWLICTALLMVPVAFAPQSRLIARSVLSPYFLSFAHEVSFLVPIYLQRLLP